MINITLIAVGKLKEKYLRDAVDEYSKRLGAFCKINIIEIDEEKIGDNPSSAQIQNVIEKEGQRIIKKIPKSSNIISLCIEGKEYSSPDFSKLIENISMTSSSICFIIGGSFGLSDEVKKLSNYKLSFGKITLPHQLARVILLEQIYRAFSISNNSKYHRAVFPGQPALQPLLGSDQLPREGEQAVNINTKVMKLKKVHLPLSL